MNRNFRYQHRKRSGFIKHSGPTPVKGVLSYVLKKYGIDKDLARYNFVLNWEEIVGEDIAKRTKPECFRGSTLVVKVCNSTWAQELSFQKEVILARLKRFTENDVIVDDLFFRVGSV